MEELTLLKDLVLILAVGVAVALVLRKLGVPSIAGFILAGILVGPRSLGLVVDTHEVELLAEIGIVLLLFGIGLELSIAKVRRLWKPILLGGALQVGVMAAEELTFRDDQRASAEYRKMICPALVARAVEEVLS